MSSITAATAIWGAVTGTAALFLQWLRHREDRAALDVKGRMTIRHSNSTDILAASELIDFEVTVVNTGRRVARIEEVGISVAGSGDASRRGPGVNILVFDGREEGVVSLSDGEKEVFSLRRWPETLEQVAESFAPKETVYVRLTSGKRFEKQFPTVSKSQLARLREQAQQDSRCVG